VPREIVNYRLPVTQDAVFCDDQVESAVAIPIDDAGLSKQGLGTTGDRIGRDDLCRASRPSSVAEVNRRSDSSLIHNYVEPAVTIPVGQRDPEPGHQNLLSRHFHANLRLCDEPPVRPTPEPIESGLRIATIVRACQQVKLSVTVDVRQLRTKIRAASSRRDSTIGAEFVKPYRLGELRAAGGGSYAGMEPHISQAAADHQVESAVAIEVPDRGVERPALALFVWKGRYRHLERLTQRRRREAGRHCRRREWLNHGPGAWMVIRSLTHVELVWSCGLDAPVQFHGRDAEGDDGDSGQEEADPGSSAEHLHR
jgi:hypothetical protein